MPVDVHLFQEGGLGFNIYTLRDQLDNFGGAIKTQLRRVGQTDVVENERPRIIHLIIVMQGRTDAFFLSLFHHCIFA